MARAMRVKSPFSQSTLFGFIGIPVRLFIAALLSRGRFSHARAFIKSAIAQRSVWQRVFPGWGVWPQNGREVLALLGRGEAKRRRASGTSKLAAR
jgi:hypothetical protein